MTTRDPLPPGRRKLADMLLAPPGPALRVKAAWAPLLDDLRARRLRSGNGRPVL